MSLEQKRLQYNMDMDQDQLENLCKKYRLDLDTI